MGAKESNKEEIEVMDTPERCKSNQIAASITKFEDSPVFNFLNSLSPIKPVKSIHISQTINPLSFASLPSVFTSPQVASLRESRFLRRHQLPDPSKPEFSSVNTQKSDKQPENLDPRLSDGEVANETSFDCSKFGENCGYATQSVSEIDRNNDVASCDWESLIDDASDMLVFDSPEVDRIEPETSIFLSIENGMQNMNSLCGVGPTEQIGEGSEPENLYTQPGEESGLMDGPSMDNDGEKLDYEHLSGFHRGIRRRCLVFEMGGTHKRHSDENSGSDPSRSRQSNGDQVDPTNSGNDSSSSRCVLPGIGLHLNALAGSQKDYKIVNNDSSSCGRLLIGPSLSVNFHPPNSDHELSNNILPIGPSESEFDDVENDIPIDENVTNDEINQSSSPKKKKRRTEQDGEGESSCKRCNCKKSKCLKLYCECFAAGVYCVEPCACIDCFNKPIHEDTVLATRKQIESRNPLAFAPKVIRGSESVSEIGDDSSKTPASARHKRGCNCKKSGCLKKYCECYQGGVGCSINCRCEGCKNAFGIKDGHGVICMEIDPEEDETNRSFQKTPIQNEHEQNIESRPPTTPIRGGRQSLEYPFSSKKKPPRSSFPAVGSSSGFYTGQGLTNPRFFLPGPPKFDRFLQTVNEDEIPEFLQEEKSPISGIKLSSPNRKRVSPPHNEGTSMRSSRKLILKSIPSFPELTHDQ